MVALTIAGIPQFFFALGDDDGADGAGGIAPPLDDADGDLDEEEEDLEDVEELTEEEDDDELSDEE